ncbi:MAG TPA: DUF5309 family protein [Methanosarcina sp.]|nr:DUF5309 family protein [Methanosarcina sp.]
MATITTSAIGNGTTAYATDIVVKDLDLDVSNRVKDDTPVLNMCMAKKRKVVSTLPLWTNDVYRAPAVQAVQEGAAVSASNAESNQRANLGNYTQIFATTVGATGTARAVEQSGGDPQAYQEVKQLIELMFDVEAQIVRNDQVGTKYSGQSGAAYIGVATSGNTQVTGATQIGRRMGSLNSFAGTHSFNAGDGTGNLAVASNQITTLYNFESSDTLGYEAKGSGNTAAFTIGGVAPAAGVTTITNNGEGLGSSFYEYTAGLQQFAPSLYKQLVTVAEKRFNAKISTVVCPTSLRTHLSDTLPTSRGINRVNSERGDTIATYEGDFNYTYEIFDSWIMDSVGASNQIYFLNEEVLQWGSLRDLGPNNEVFSNADASLDQFILEGTLIVRNPAGVAVLHDISASGTYVGVTGGSTNQYGASGSLRPSAYVQRLSAWDAVAF